MTIENKQYLCEVILPENAPIRSVIGRPSARKAIAKQSAAFEACLRLRQDGYLDGHLLPIYHKHLPAMRNAHLALDMKKTNLYEMRIKPSLWETQWGAIPEELYFTILDLVTKGNGPTPVYKSLAMLTREPLPDFPVFPLHPQPGVISEVNCKRVPLPLKVTASSLAKLTSFTLRIFKDIFNKTYEVNEERMSYWLAPLLDGAIYADRGSDSGSLIDLDIQCSDAIISPNRFPSPDTLIDWKTVDFVQDNDEITWSRDTPHEEMVDRYLIDRWDGGRRFFSVGVEPSLCPLDPLPEGCAPHKYNNNILDYTVSLFAKSRARVTWEQDQPVLKATRVLHRRNWLDDWSDIEKEVKTLAYVCPQPLKFSAVSILSDLVYLFSLTFGEASDWSRTHGIHVPSHNIPSRVLFDRLRRLQSLESSNHTSTSFRSLH